MHTRLLGLVIAGAVICSAASIVAHHSTAATYRHEQITIDGVLMTLRYRNPHSFLEVSAPDTGGQMRLWAVECRSGQQLRRSLLDGTLKPGDKVVVTGDAGRDEGAWRLRLRSIVRSSDGWAWHEGLK